MRSEPLSIHSSHRWLQPRKCTLYPWEGGRGGGREGGRKGEREEGREVSDTGQGVKLL